VACVHGIQTKARQSKYANKTLSMGRIYEKKNYKMYRAKG